MNEAELKVLIGRVTESVVSEVKRSEAERGISIAELRDHATELGGGKLPSAWKISYDTSGNLVGNAMGPAAWKISYDTSGKALLPGDGVK